MKDRNCGEGALKTMYQCYGAEPMPCYANCDEGYCAMETLAEYEDTGITPGQIREIDRLYAEKCKEVAECRKTQREYEDLEEQGKLLKLPCKARDIVWDIDFGRPCSYEVTGFSFGILNDYDWEEEKVLDQIVVYYTNSNGSITGTFAVSEIGKTVFLTREEAEAALKGLGEG